MKNSLFILVFFFIVSNALVHSQSLKHQFELFSESVADKIYPIEVLLPDDYDSTTRYPIV